MLTLMPFADEVIGMLQFNALCKSNGIESADISKARGKRVKVEHGGRAPLDGTILPIKESNARFSDADTGELLIQHKEYFAEGGWLMRYTWLSLGSNHPMLFSGFCDSQKQKEIFKANRITFLYR